MRINVPPTSVILEAAVAVIDGYHDVPPANVGTNAQIRDVVGNKTDAPIVEYGNLSSMVAYIKGLVYMLNPPTVDLTTALYFRDSIGHKSDAAQTTVATTRSIMGYVKGILNQIASHITALATHDGKLDVVDTVVDAVKAKTDNLPASPAAVGDSAGGDVYFIGDDLLHSNDAEVSTNATSYAKQKSIGIGIVNATIRVAYDYRATDAAHIAAFRIYKNGVAHGTEQTSSSATYANYSEDLAFVRGDRLELYAYTNDAGKAAYVRNLRIKGMLFKNFVNF